MNLSDPPLIILFPYWLNMTDLTNPLCPFSYNFGFLFIYYRFWFTLKTFMILSKEEVARYLLSKDQSME